MPGSVQLLFVAFQFDPVQEERELALDLAGTVGWRVLSVSRINPSKLDNSNGISLRKSIKIMASDLKSLLASSSAWIGYRCCLDKAELLRSFSLNFLLPLLWFALSIIGGFGKRSRIRDGARKIRYFSLITSAALIRHKWKPLFSNEWTENKTNNNKSKTISAQRDYSNLNIISLSLRIRNVLRHRIRGIAKEPKRRNFSLSSGKYFASTQNGFYL